MTTPLETVREGLAVVAPGAEDVASLSAGYEAEIFALSVGEARLVLRLFPDARADAKSAWEAFVLGRLQEVGYPAPRAHRQVASADSPWGRPFLLMDRVAGDPDPAFWGPPGLARDAARDRVFGLMARLHALDASRFFRGAAEGRLTPLGELAALCAGGGKAGAELGAAVLPKLRKALPTVETPCVLHGDLHANNVLCGAEGCWVIDWPNAGLGDPREDFAWVRLLVRADDDPDRGQGDVARYEAASGKPLGDLRPFEALGAARILAQGLAVKAGEDHGLRVEAVGSFGAGPGFGSYLCDLLADRLGVDVARLL